MPVLVWAVLIGRRGSFAALNPVVEGRVREYRDDFGMWCNVKGEEDILPEHPSSLRKTNVVFHQERAAEELVRVGGDQRMDVLTVNGVLHIGCVDTESPRGLIGAGLLAVQHVGAVPGGHRITRL